MNDSPDNPQVPEPVAPTPPPELAPYVAAFAQEAIAKASAEGDSISDWEKIIERMGMGDAVEEIDRPGSLPHNLVVALLLLPDGECHALSKQHPREFTGLAGLAWEWLTEQGAPDASTIAPRLLAPEVLAAFNWLLDNQTAAMMRSCGIGRQLN